MKKAYLSFVAFLALFENVVSAFALLFATVFTVVQVVNRYWLHYEIIWLSDLTLYIFVVGAIFSIALTTRQDAHVGVDVFVVMLCKGEKAKKLSKIIINFASLGLLFLILPLFYAFFLRSLKFAEWGTLVRWFNTSWLVQCIFAMFVLNVFHIVHNTVVHILDFCKLCGGGAKECPSD